MLSSRPLADGLLRGWLVVIVLCLPDLAGVEGSPFGRRYPPRPQAFQPPPQRELRPQGTDNQTPLVQAVFFSRWLTGRCSFYSCKVCDFGLARSVKTAEPNGTETGFMTVRFLSMSLSFVDLADRKDDVGWSYRSTLQRGGTGLRRSCSRSSSTPKFVSLSFPLAQIRPVGSG